MPQLFDEGPIRPKKKRKGGEAPPHYVGTEALEHKVAAAERASFGTLTSDIVFAAALVSQDDREAARAAATIARHIDPPPLPRPRGRRGQPVAIIDPLTGEPISLKRQRALAAASFGVSLADVLKQRLARVPDVRGRERILVAPIDPDKVATYVEMMDPLPGRVPADLAVGFAIDMARTKTDPGRFGANLKVISDWNAKTRTITEAQAIAIARYWAENHDEILTPGDLVVLTAPEVETAIRALEQTMPKGPRAGPPTTSSRCASPRSPRRSARRSPSRSPPSASSSPPGATSPTPTTC